MTDPNPPQDDQHLLLLEQIRDELAKANAATPAPAKPEISLSDLRELSAEQVAAMDQRLLHEILEGGENDDN